jgi:hypothetical protein
MLAKQGNQVYPYQIGSTVKSDSTGTSLTASGIGTFRALDYIMLCNPVSYGETELYVPDTAKVTKVTAVAETTGVLTILPAITATKGDYIVNLGPDALSPGYDASRITLYTDPNGNDTNANNYLLTGQGGLYRGWVSKGTRMVDLLIADSSGVPAVVQPFVSLTPEMDEPYFNVLDYGSGDVTSINATIAAAGAAGGGRVYLPPGTYALAAGEQILVDQDDIIFEGAGDATSITQTGSSLTEPFKVTGDRVTLRDFKLTGNRGQASQAAVLELASGCNNCSVYNVFSDESGASGILVGGTDCQVFDCRINNCQTNAIQFDSTSIGSSADLNYITNTGQGSGTTQGIAITAGATNTMVGRNFTDALRYDGMVETGITADVGSAQGDGALTSDVNVIATCAIAGDAVTLPAATPGRRIVVINLGAQSADVFPATGDTIGTGAANLPLALPADDTAVFVGVSTSAWYATIDDQANGA